MVELDLILGTAKHSRKKEMLIRRIEPGTVRSLVFRDR